jgi:hypothetical protein
MGGFGWGFGTGLLMGGLSGWMFGSSLCNWGYTPYRNPYYVPTNTVVVTQPVYVDGASQATLSQGNYNYSQPLNTEAPAPDQATSDAALNIFDQARSDFMNANYPAGFLHGGDRRPPRHHRPRRRRHALLSLQEIRHQEQTHLP